MLPRTLFASNLNKQTAVLNKAELAWPRRPTFTVSYCVASSPIIFKVLLMHRQCEAPYSRREMPKREMPKGNFAHQKRGLVIHCACAVARTKKARKAKAESELCFIEHCE